MISENIIAIILGFMLGLAIYGFVYVYLLVF